MVGGSSMQRWLLLNRSLVVERTTRQMEQRRHSLCSDTVPEGDFRRATQRQISALSASIVEHGIMVKKTRGWLLRGTPHLDPSLPRHSTNSRRETGNVLETKMSAFF